MDSQKIFNEINDGCLCLSLRKISRSVTHFFDRALRPSGLRITQFTLLLAIREVSAETLTQIAEKLVMDRTTLTRNMRPLEDSGLVEVDKEKEKIYRDKDRRVKAYKLTPKGEDLLDAAIPLWNEADISLKDLLGDKKHKIIVKELCELLKTISGA